MANDKEFFYEEEGIDQERVVQDEQQVAEEFLCAICQGLLWKPKACASCQHLFCNKCIRSWLKIHPTSCPFRCSPYEEKRAPPYIHSLLDRLSIRCRNNTFGCSEVLSYGRLELHQVLECHFSTRKCRVCEQYVLVSELDQHQESCISTMGICFLCKSLVDRATLPQHTMECFKARLNHVFDQIIPPELTVNLPQVKNEEHRVMPLTDRLQQFLAAQPRVDLVGFDAVVQARERNVWLRIWTLVQLIVLNVTQAPYIILLLLSGGIGFLIGVLITLSVSIQRQVNRSPYRSFFAMILGSVLLNFGLSTLLARASDAWIILCFAVILLLCALMLPELPLDNFRLPASNIVILIGSLIALVVFKLCLLGIRFYFCYLPPYISASISAWILIFCTFHLRRY